MVSPGGGQGYCLQDRLDWIERPAWGHVPPPWAPGRREATAHVKRMARRSTVYDDRLAMLAEIDIFADLSRAEIKPAQLAVTHEQVAAMVGTSRETATKALGEYAEQGLLKLKRGRIVVLDPDRLAAEAGDS
jgi:hypothetical protein